MATQDTSKDLPVWYEPEQENLRLLELPPDLLESVTNGSPPSLFLKSAEPASNKAPSHLVLCTKDQTFQLRQVQTSNSILVVRPESQASNDLDPPENGLSLFAKCDSTLEISALNKTDAAKIIAPTQWLRDLTSPFSGEGSRSTTTKDTVLANIPYSDGELEEAWMELCGFCTEGDRAFIPTPNILVEAWNTFLMNASVLAMDPADPVMLTDSLTEMLDGTGYPLQLFEAMLKRTSKPSPDQDIRQYTLDKDLTITFTGKALFDAGDYPSQPWKFVEAWKGMLPELWREEVTTATYGKLRSAANDTDIRITELMAHLAGTAAVAPDAAPAKRAGGPSRDWHERFKRNRK